MFQLGHRVFDVKKIHHFKGKVVVCMRGYDITGFLQENPHAYDPYFKSCDLFLPVCDFFTDILVAAGCSKEKIRVVHSAIDCAKFAFKAQRFPTRGSINIISAGRFVEKKGFVYSIRAIARALKRFFSIQYRIIGDGELKNKFIKLIRKLGLQHKILLDGWHAHEQYIHILNGAHIFIAPSVTAENNDQEGIPNVLKEAMAIGLLVIATDHAGNGELIDHGISGLLVPERDSDAIVRAIERILTHPQDWSAMQLAARKKIEQEFELEKENDKLEALLLDLLR